MALDDGLRGQFGIVLSLVEEEDGFLRLVLDDVERVRDLSPTHWKTSRFFTQSRFEKTEFIEGNLSPRELEQIGLNVVSRLAALEAQPRKTPKPQ